VQIAVGIAVKIIVSDHALLRYIERVRGFDLDKLRLEIADTVHIATLGGASSVSRGGFKYVLAYNQGKCPVVTTVGPDEMRTRPRIGHVTKSHRL
jgi:hypothetical protein